MNSFFRHFLWPFAFIYGVIIFIRNLLFTLKILPTCKPHIPVIAVGNLSTGGTGKTPHVEYLAQQLLSAGYKIAIISRGYKRKSKGLVIASKEHTFLDLGDEPFQYYLRFRDNKNVIIAVHKKRCKAIRHILKHYPAIDVILLDDAYQHRYVHNRLNILLSDYYHPYFKDFLIPVGNLREPRSAARRADIIVITKSPKVISPLDKKYFLHHIRPTNHQEVFFTRLSYHQPIHIYTQKPIEENKKFSTVFIVCAIANPYPFIQHCKKFGLHHELFIYPDHHLFTTYDFEKLKKAFQNHVSTNKIIFTTEKDMVRMTLPSLRPYIEELPIFYIPITIEEFCFDNQGLTQKVIAYVRTNQANK